MVMNLRGTEQAQPRSKGHTSAVPECVCAAGSECTDGLRPHSPSPSGLEV